LSPPPTLTLFPYTTLFRSRVGPHPHAPARLTLLLGLERRLSASRGGLGPHPPQACKTNAVARPRALTLSLARRVRSGWPGDSVRDRKSRRLKSSHVARSYA